MSKVFTIGKILDHLMYEYEHALKKNMILKPMSYALYQTWKWVDSIEESSGKGKEEDVKD